MQQAPGLPCALNFEEGQTKMQTSGDQRRENAKPYPTIIARWKFNFVARMSAATSGTTGTAPDIAALIRATG